MGKIAVRGARDDEAQFIVHMIRYMVADMATYGGYAPATDHEAWETLSVAVAAELHGQNSKYVIAEAANKDQIGVAGAELRTLGGAFAPKKTLHINVLYVLPSLRRNGIGVLSKNPARSLYEKHGFSVVEVKMVCSL
jgi:ribosomal protein S18 acetylase RimI-like enzyme